MLAAAAAGWRGEPAPTGGLLQPGAFMVLRKYEYSYVAFKNTILVIIILLRLCVCFPVCVLAAAAGWRGEGEAGSLWWRRAGCGWFIAHSHMPLLDA